MLRKNVCEIMLDTTGEGLHKRGYRRNAMEAPIRETLAATIADLGRVRRDSQMCIRDRQARARRAQKRSAKKPKKNLPSERRVLYNSNVSK